MIAGLSPLNQTILGTLFTWGLTAAGAALVFVLNSTRFVSGKKREGQCNASLPFFFAFVALIIAMLKNKA